MFRRLRAEYPFLLVLTLLGFLLHAESFRSVHAEGDEVVYLGLAREMRWSGSNYTTANVELVKEFPARLYRSPVFIHPPLYPLLLKVFSLIGSPVQLGLLFGLGIHLATAFVIWAVVPGWGGALGAVFAMVCPVLTTATTKIHVDGLAGFLLLASVVSLLRARRTEKTRDWVLAGVWAGLFANSKLTALAILPALAIWVLLEVRRLPVRKWLPGRGAWLLVLALLAAPHPLRLWITYGSPYPAELLVRERPLSPFLMQILARTRLWSLTVLSLLSPPFLLVFVPRAWSILRRRLSKRGEWRILASALVTSVLSIALLHHGTERYWAIFLPLVYLKAAWVAPGLAREGREPALQGYAAPFLGLSVVLMAVASFFNSVLRPDFDVIEPALKLMMPGLRDLF
jgi:hypothetical protein